MREAFARFVAFGVFVAFLALTTFAAIATFPALGAFGSHGVGRGRAGRVRPAVSGAQHLWAPTRFGSRAHKLRPSFVPVPENGVRSSSSGTGTGFAWARARARVL